MITLLCDATLQTGLGHFMRSASLAQAMAEQGVPTTFIGEFQPLALELATQLGIEIEPSTASIEQRARQLPAGSRIIIDSYQYDPQTLPTEHQYVLIDDFCCFENYPVAGVVNFTINARQYDYISRGAGAQALGPVFFLPNPMLERSVGPPRENIRNILIIIGSSDRHGITSRILDALTTTTAYNLRVIRNHTEALQKNFPKVQFVPPTHDIGAHYDWSDFCITGGGLAKYECAWMGKPAAVISQTEAENAETRQFSSRNLCFDLGFAQQLTSDQIADGLREVFENTEHRRAAHIACLFDFTQNSAGRAAAFTKQCLQT